MSRLYLQCVICGRKQATGLLSSAAWGHLPLPDGVKVDHPAVRESGARACPTCVRQEADWPARALASLGLAGAQ